MTKSDISEMEVPSGSVHLLNPLCWFGGCSTKPCVKSLSRAPVTLEELAARSVQREDVDRRNGQRPFDVAQQKVCFPLEQT